MATASVLDLAERRFLIRGIGWDGYELLLDAFGDDGPRLTYYRGDAEIMSPVSLPHERPVKLLAYLIEALTVELDIPMDATRSTTFRRRDAEVGLEADESYYLHGRVDRLRGGAPIDLDVDPPPDLAVEVELTNPLLPKLAIYAEIGVPEIWLYRREVLSVLLLQADGRYAESPTSRAFPFLPMDEVGRRVAGYDPSRGTAWRREAAAWIRRDVLPLYGPPADG